MAFLLAAKTPARLSVSRSIAGVPPKCPQSLQPSSPAALILDHRGNKGSVAIVQVESPRVGTVVKDASGRPYTGMALSVNTGMVAQKKSPWRSCPRLPFLASCAKNGMCLTLCSETGLCTAVGAYGGPTTSCAVYARDDTSPEPCPCTDWLQCESCDLSTHGNSDFTCEWWCVRCYP